MIIDYTRIFRDADDLAAFLMLPNEAQDKFLAEVAGEKNIGLAAACNLPSQDKPEDTHA